jgi:hypothetical protein
MALEVKVAWATPHHSPTSRKDVIWCRIYPDSSTW